MGKFIYQGSVRADFDDRLLSHLQVVVGTKLRRNEPFFFTWAGEVANGSGRTSVWVHGAADLVFGYYGKRQVAINRTWLEALMRSANSPGGLMVVPEPAETPDTESPEVLVA